MDRANVIRLDRWVVAGATAVLVVLYALRGGTYDVVARHQAGIVVWTVVLLVFFAGVAVRREGSRGLLVPAGALLALTAWTALSLGWTSSDERTLVEVARVGHYAGLLLLARAVLTRTNWTAAVAGATTAAALVCLLALVSRLQPSWFPADDVERVLEARRLAYPFGYWNALAAWAAMTLPACLAWSAHASRTISRCLAAAALPACGLTAYLTYSRASLIGVLLGLVAVLALSRNRWTEAWTLAVALPATALLVAVTRSNPEVALGTGGAGAARVLLALGAACLVTAAAPLVARRIDFDRRRLGLRQTRTALALAAVVVGVTLSIVAIDKGPSAWRNFTNESSTALERANRNPAARFSTVSGRRYALWSEALSAGLDRPIRGIGPGTYEFWWSQRAPITGFERDAHSLYLEQFAELGIPGLVLLLTCFGALLVLADRSRRFLGGAREVGVHAGCIAGFLVFLFQAGIDWMWEVTGVGALGLLFAAIAIAPSVGETRRRTPGTVRVVGVLLAVVLIAVQLPSLASTERVRESQEAFIGGRVDQALQLADAAVRAEPWAATPLAQRAGIEEAAGSLEVATRDLERAVAREPLNWRYPLLLSRVQGNRGNPVAALRWFRQARRLRPRASF